MELLIVRTQGKKGTNGGLYINGEFHSYTIELPWKYNIKGESCIPEGRYKITKRWSLKYGSHLLINGTAPRDLILFHPANNALKELKGCIAPVTTLTGEGLGSESKKAFTPLRDKVYAALAKGEEVWLNIKKK